MEPKNSFPVPLSALLRDPFTEIFIFPRKNEDIYYSTAIL